MLPTGAQFKSPDKILDKTTGLYREVDASIRIRVGSTPMLITIECRDRKGIEDVTWIEQVAQKKVDIGAAITIAVSTAGFSSGATRKAAAIGIQLRTLSKVTADDVANWLKAQCVTLDLRIWNLAGLALELYDTSGDLGLSADVQTEFKRVGKRAEILRRQDNRVISVEQFLIEIDNDKSQGSFIPQELPCDGTPVYNVISVEIARGALSVGTASSGFQDIKTLKARLKFIRHRKQVPIERLAEYADPQRRLMQSAEWKIAPEMRFSAHHDLDSGETKFSISLESPEDEK